MESKKQSRIQKKTITKIQKKYRKRLTENKQVVATGGAGWRTNKMGEGNSEAQTPRRKYRSHWDIMVTQGM